MQNLTSPVVVLKKVWTSSAKANIMLRNQTKPNKANKYELKKNKKWLQKNYISQHIYKNDKLEML